MDDQTPAPALIETMRVDGGGRIPLLDRHMARLQASCAALGHACNAGAIRDQVLAAAGKAGMQGPQRLRLLVDAAGGRTLQMAPLPELPGTPSVRLWTTRLNSAEPLLRHKTTHRPWYDGVTQWLSANPGVFDAILANERGELCEGSRTNIYVLLAGKWYTPPVDCGCLPGVQRAALLDERQVEERVLYPDDLPRARGIRLSNALRGWRDVVLQQP